MKPGDLVAAWCSGWPAESRPRDEGMILMRHRQDGCPGLPGTDDFLVPWKSLGIVVHVDSTDEHRTRVLVMIDGRIGWNTATCFDRVHDVELP